MTAFSYSFRRSALSSERRYSLAPDRLTWTGDTEGSVAYQSIAKVKVYQRRFWGSSKSYWTCILYPYEDKAIYLGAANCLRGRTIEDRSETYIPFIKELEARVAAANVNVCFVTGRGWLSWIEGGVGWVAVKILRAIRHFDCDRSANVLATIMRKLGPWLRGQRTARAQLQTTFPEKSREEIEKLLDGMWDNIGRVIVEYAHLDTLWEFDPARPEAGRILIDQIVVDRLQSLGRNHGPALMFGAHLANWELLGLTATAIGRDIILVYRQPKIAALANEIIKIRGSGVAGTDSCGSRRAAQDQKCAAEEPSRGNAGRSVRRQGHRGQFFWTQLPRQCHARARCPPLRMPNLRRSRGPFAGSPLPP